MSTEGGDMLADGEVGSLTLEDDIVNPWEVASKSATGVDYDKLISMISNFFSTLSFSSIKFIHWVDSRLEMISLP